MASPNLISATTITLKSTATALTAASSTVVVGNASTSGAVKKVTSLTAANVDGTNNTTFTLSLNTSSSGGGTSYRIGNTLDLYADKTLVAIDRNNPVYVMENQSLVALAGSTDDIDVVASYEEIS